jgi:predicted transposase/invertase (TIGR01784 family)
VKTDTIFYRLFQEFPGIFFELIGRQYLDARDYEFASVELKQTAFRIDGVFIPTVEPPNQPVYFVEVQFQLDTTFYRRFFAEIHLYLRQKESVNLWRAVVLYPSRSAEPDDVVPYHELLYSQRITRIYLDELGETTSLGLGIVKLIVETEQAAIERARGLILQARQELPEASTRQEILDIIETILLYKFNQLSREELAAMLGLIDDDFRQTRMYQSIKQEGLEEGLEQGLEQGLQQGRLRAKLEAVRPLLALGLTIEQVAEALGLTLEQVQQAATLPSN